MSEQSATYLTKLSNVCQVLCEWMWELDSLLSCIKSWMKEYNDTNRKSCKLFCTLAKLMSHCKCLCVCMCVCLCVWVWVCMFIMVRMCVCLSVCACLDSWLCKYICECMYVCVCVCVCVCLCVCACVHTCVRMHGFDDPVCTVNLFWILKCQVMTV